MNRIGKGLCAFALTLAAALGCGDDAKPQQSGSAGSAGKISGSAGDPQAGEAGNPASGGSAQGGSAPSGAGEPAVGEAGEAGESGGDMLDPCRGISTQGQCITIGIALSCVVPTGNGSPRLVTTKCRSFEHCDESSGQARCVLDDDACIPDQAQCLDAKRLRTCSANGAWQTETCPGACRDSAVGGFCVQAGATTTFNGTLMYDAAQVYDDYSDWAPSFDSLPAEGVLVLSADGDQFLDAALVDDKGAYSIQVPTTKNGDEQLIFFLLHLDKTGAVAQLGVFNPDVADGVVSTDVQLTGNPWSWAVALADAIKTPAIQITEEQGSGAIYVYTRLLAVRSYVSEFYQKEPGTVVAWLRLNTAWDCGACFLGQPVEVSSTPFDSQIFISADAQDRAYWSDAVTVHETGHYTMWSYGVPPNEGGEHCLSEPSAPGLAWSEGWATGFSSILRASPIYWDKQQGSMFWFDLGERKYTGANWQRPNPKGGLLQDIDENEVAAMLWSLANNASVGPDKTLLGLTTPSVTHPDFKRGYTTHAWETQDCKRIGLTDTGESAPMFADYLDGLVCGGVPAAAIDAATNPKQAYPYPSQAPLCQ